MKQDIFNQARLRISCDVADDILSLFFTKEELYVESEGGFSFTEEAQDKFNLIQEWIEKSMIEFATELIYNEISLEDLKQLT